VRTMYDSITPAAIPRDAQMVAGYVDGLYAWKQADWDRFPRAVKVTITALGLDQGVVLNLEPNGYWPSDLGVGWVRRARARGVDPTIYCNYRNHLHLAQAAFDRAKEPRPHFWVAEYNGVQNIPTGCIAKQYAAPEGTGAARAPAHYDISIVADHWPGVDGDDMPSAKEVVDELFARRLHFEIPDPNKPGATIQYSERFDQAIADVYAQTFWGLGRNTAWGPGVVVQLRALLAAFQQSTPEDLDVDALLKRVDHTVRQAVAESTIDVDVTVGGQAIDTTKEN
jgi:hypothetical protein